MNAAKYIMLPLVLTYHGTQAATVVVDTNISLTVPIVEPEDYKLTVQQDPAFDVNPTSILFDRDGLTRLRFVIQNADEGSDWYLAEFGDSFSKETIESGDFGFIRLKRIVWEILQNGAELDLRSGSTKGGRPYRLHRRIAP